MGNFIWGVWVNAFLDLMDWQKCQGSQVAPFLQYDTQKCEKKIYITKIYLKCKAIFTALYIYIYVCNFIKVQMCRSLRIFQGGALYSPLGPALFLFPISLFNHVAIFIKAFVVIRTVRFNLTWF